MRTKFLLAVALIAAAVCTAAPIPKEDRAGTHFYVQPGFALVSMGENFTSTAALTAAAGVFFAEHHSVEVEGLFFTTEPDIPSPTYELRFSMALATYKYHFDLGHGLSVFAGGSLGSAGQSASAKPGYVILGDRSDNAYAAGVSGGVGYSLNPNIHFEAGLRTLRVGQTRFTTSGSIALLQSSVRFQF